MDPLPASEVRRRGTRMRRRNNALAAVGGVAAVALHRHAAGDGGHRATAPTPRPPVTQPVPGRVGARRSRPTSRSTDGMPDGATAMDRRPYGTGSTSAARTPAARSRTAPERPTSPAQPSTRPSSEGAEARTLALYPDDAAAIAATVALQELVADCGTDANGAGDPAAQRGRMPATWAATRRWSSPSRRRAATACSYDLTAMVVVRTGNAVYVVEQPHAAPAATQVVDAGRRTGSSRRSPAPVVDAMCVFAADPC